MQARETIKHILRNSNHGQFIRPEGSGWASSNVALVKYWGKRDNELNLPQTSSLSVSLGNKGAYTRVSVGEDQDSYIVNGVNIDLESSFARRLKNFLDLFRAGKKSYVVKTDSNIPIAAGFASSACGFAALVLALNNLYDWRLSKADLSILARLGSGSACRSLWDGFVEWQRGSREDGLDSYGVKLDYFWPELRVGMLNISSQEKKISSRDAMALTVATSPYYSSWVKQVEVDLEYLKLALVGKDFELLGSVAENNAQAMHGVMNASNPAINYSLPETLQAIEKVQELRSSGVPLFFTQDAGPNIQLIFLADSLERVLREFPMLDVVMPFASGKVTQLILVNEHDVEVGTSEKMAVHIQGALHRAFSIVIMRKCSGRLEVLLQKRSRIKYHSAGLWSNSCCGHPKPGEDIISAGKRRLQEEMGFCVPLKEVGKFHYQAKFANVDLIENELDHLLVGFCDLDEFAVNQDEVDDYQWLDLELLKIDLAEHPEKYTVWLPPVLDSLLANSSNLLK